MRMTPRDTRILLIEQTFFSVNNMCSKRNLVLNTTRFFTWYMYVHSIHLQLAVMMPMSLKLDSFSIFKLTIVNAVESSRRTRLPHIAFHAKTIVTIHNNFVILLLGSLLFLERFFFSSE